MIKVIILIFALLCSKSFSSQLEDEDFACSLDLLFENYAFSESSSFSEAKQSSEPPQSSQENVHEDPDMMDICQALLQDDEQDNQIPSVQTFTVQTIQDLRYIMQVIKPNMPHFLPLVRFEYDLGSLIDDCKSMNDIHCFMRHVLDSNNSSSSSSSSSSNTSSVNSSSSSNTSSGNSSNSSNTTSGNTSNINN